MNCSHFYSLICGKLLGDGCITKQEGRKPRLQFIHRLEDFGWTQFCYEELKCYVPVNAPKYKKVIDHRLTKGYSESYFVQSKTDELITSLYNIWYHNNKKILPRNFIIVYLNAQSLSWWYQDDGHLKIEKRIPRKIILSTDSFSKEENLWLIELLYTKFKLRFRLDGQNRLILYDQRQIMTFLKLVDPYIHISMTRKRLILPPLKSIAKRTTVYLSTDLAIKKPSFEINKALDYLMTRDEDNLLDFINGRSNKKLCNGFQIQINPKFHPRINQLRMNTGLTVSEIIEACFIAKKKTRIE